MPFEFKLPDLGEGVVEGEIVKWKVKEGDDIKLDQPMVEVMTDKATVETLAPRGGKVAKLMVAEGKICAVGQVLIVIDDGSAAAVAPVVVKAVTPPKAGPPPVPPANGKPKAEPTHMSTQLAGNIPEASSGARPLATPATRRLAREMGVELDSVQPTGKRGRITSDDVRSHQTRPASPGHSPMSIGRDAADERVPFRGMRKAIAANLSRSKQTAAHFTYVEEIDMTDLVQLRGRTKEKAATRGGKLSYLPFLIKAAVTSCPLSLLTSSLASRA